MRVEARFLQNYCAILPSHMKIVITIKKGLELKLLRNSMVMSNVSISIHFDAPEKNSKASDFLMFLGVKNRKVGLKKRLNLNKDAM